MGTEASCDESPLRPNDMILEVNGKDVASLTEASLAIELEIAGPDLLLLISRYKFPKQIIAAQHEHEKKDLHQVDSSMKDEHCLEWTQTKEGSTDDRRYSLEIEERERSMEEEAPNEREGKPDERQPETRATAPEPFIPDQTSNEATIQVDKLNPVVDSLPKSSSQTVEEDCICSLNNPEESQGSEQSDSSDGNAWMGCVCQVSHRVKPVFWLQCDDCQSWWNVNAKCIGFDEETAKTMSAWSCPACAPVEEGGDAEEKDDTTKDNQNNTSVVAGKSSSLVERDESPLLDSSNCRIQAGDTVLVEEHGWAGVNNPGGIAKVLRVDTRQDDGVVYDIQYIVGKDKFKNVLSEYVSRYEFD